MYQAQAALGKYEEVANYKEPYVNSNSIGTLLELNLKQLEELHINLSKLEARLEPVLIPTVGQLNSLNGHIMSKYDFESPKPLETLSANNSAIAEKIIECSTKIKTLSAKIDSLLANTQI